MDLRRTERLTRGQCGEHFRAGKQLRGFTLVEVLIVIGIIAVLLTIILPSVARARFQAKLVRCASNQRQYVNAMQMHAMSNKGVLPSFDGTTGAGNLHDLTPAWYKLFSKTYGLSDDFFFCPFHEEHLNDLNTSGFVISGYEIWIPRRQTATNPASQIPPDPTGSIFTVVGTDVIRGPARLNDPLASTNPIISDDILLYPAAVSNPATFEVSEAPSTSFYNDRMGHTLQGRLAATNVGFLDGRVEVIPPAAVKLRYKSGNAWNCR